MPSLGATFRRSSSYRPTRRGRERWEERGSRLSWRCRFSRRRITTLRASQSWGTVLVLAAYRSCGPTTKLELSGINSNPNEQVLIPVENYHSLASDPNRRWELDPSGHSVQAIISIILVFKNNLLFHHHPNCCKSKITHAELGNHP